jgi:hypothetical protein
MSGNPWTPAAYAAVCNRLGVEAWLVNSAGSRLARLAFVRVPQGVLMEDALRQAWQDCLASPVEHPDKRDALGYLAYEFGLTDTPPPRPTALPEWKPRQ